MSRENTLGRVVAPGVVDFITRPAPAPGPGEVVIEVRASAICGSDLHIFKGKHPTAPLPATIGHEFAGDVVETGAGVTLPLGTRVTLEPCIVCGVCEACRHGSYGYCENISFTYRNGDGAMARYVTAKAAHVFPLPDGMPYEQGALIEPLAVATHAVRRADVRLGENVLILGGGAIGLLTAAVCRASGANLVVVSDTNDGRLALAKEMGATHTVNPAKGGDAVAEALKLTGGRGMDKTFECVGREVTLVQAMEALRRGGTATVVGIFEEPMATVPVMRFINHEITVQGAQGYCWDFPIALQLAQNSIPLDKLVTHTFPLNKLQTALETALDPTTGSMKVLLQP